MDQLDKLLKNFLEVTRGGTPQNDEGAPMLEDDVDGGGGGGGYEGGGGDGGGVGYGGGGGGGFEPRGPARYAPDDADGGGGGGGYGGEMDKYGMGGGPPAAGFNSRPGTQASMMSLDAESRFIR